MPRIPAATQPTQSVQPTQQKPAMAKPKPIEQEPLPKPVQVIERRIETVVVEIPLGEPPHRFDQVHVDGWLRRDAANTFARLRQALRDRGAKTDDGRPVASNADIIRWLMEQFAGA